MRILARGMGRVARDWIVLGAAALLVSEYSITSKSAVETRDGVALDPVPSVIYLVIPTPRSGLLRLS